YDRTPLHTFCADKFKVRDYVVEKMGDDTILIPLLFTTQKSSDLVPENLPEPPFIIKTNHTSGHYKIVRDKLCVDWGDIQKNFGKWLKDNIYYSRKEWQYKNIEPRIVIERLLT